MFNNQKFLTRGIESEIPAWLVHLHVAHGAHDGGRGKDYLQVFTLTKPQPVSTLSTSRNSRRIAMNSMYRVTMP